MNRKKPLIIIAGPTAVGKSDLAVNFAKEFGGEVISADSMQVYRGLDIGSAKITPEEMQGVPHHLIDVLDPKEPFNVAVFQRLAKDALAEIYSRGRIPVICGGTGFYIQSVLYDIDFTENPADLSVRNALMKTAEEEGAEAIREKLLKIDPESAAGIDGNNVKRMIRAIEYYEMTGEKISVHNARERAKESPYDSHFYVLTMDRERLYERIDARVDRMMEAGLLQETEKLKNCGCTREMTSMQGLGYKQLYRYLEGECSLPEAVESIKIETRHFAKRQLTWFRREKAVRWIDVEKEQAIDVLRTWNLG